MDVPRIRIRKTDTVKQEYRLRTATIRVPTNDRFIRKVRGGDGRPIKKKPNTKNQKTVPVRLRLPRAKCIMLHVMLQSGLLRNAACGIKITVLLFFFQRRGIKAGAN